MTNKEIPPTTPPLKFEGFSEEEQEQLQEIYELTLDSRTRDQDKFDINFILGQKDLHKTEQVDTLEEKRALISSLYRDLKSLYVADSRIRKIHTSRMTNLTSDSQYEILTDLLTRLENMGFGGYNPHPDPMGLNETDWD